MNDIGSSSISIDGDEDTWYEGIDHEDTPQEVDSASKAQGTPETKDA